MARILFLGIEYFDYTRRIIAEMESQGHQVTFYPIELASTADKLRKRYHPAAFRRKLTKYHRQILATEQLHTYDKVLFLQVHWMVLDVLRDFRASFLQAEFVLYNWDSLQTHDYRAFVPLFDRSLTFDPVDAHILGQDHLPLFALPEYFRIDRTRAKAFDLYFVGAIVTPERVRAIKALKAHATEFGLRLNLHLHCSLAGMAKLLRHGLWTRGLTTRSVTHGRILEMIEQSEAVFDFANHRQSGYTMRLVENLCAGMKIVTSNTRISDDPVFSPDRFLVVGSGLDLSGLKAFLSALPPPKADFSAFSLENWVRRLLGETAGDNS